MDDELLLIIIERFKRAQLCWAVYLRSTQNRHQKAFNKGGFRLCTGAWHC